MAHKFNNTGGCEKCSTRRHFVSELNKYIYLLPDGQRTLVEPTCVDNELDGPDYSLLWEVLVYLLVCAGIYLVATLAKDQRERKQIEQYHSPAAPAKGSVW